MKLKVMWSAAFALVALWSCSHEGEDVLKGADVVFDAACEPVQVPVRTSLSQNGVSVIWNVGDMISVLDGVSNVAYETSMSGADVRFLSETGVADGTSEVYAVYPYAEDNVLSGDGVKVTFPDFQQIHGTGFASGSNLAVAYSDGVTAETPLQFRNVCAFIRYSVSSDEGASQVVVKGVRNEHMAGRVTVAFGEDGTPVVKDVENASSQIVLADEDDMDGTYLIPVLPVTLGSGYIVLFRNADGMVARADRSMESVPLSRNQIFDLGTVENLQWKYAPQVRMLTLDSDMAAFTWSIHNWGDTAADLAGDYTLTLYSDPSLTSVLETCQWKDIAADASETMVSFRNLKPSTDYWFVVTDNDTRISSDVFAFRTIDEGLISNAPVVSIDKYLLTGVDISWTCRAVADGFIIKLDGEKVAEVGPDVFEYTLTDLAFGTDYTVTVTAVFGTGREETSEPLVVSMGSIPAPVLTVGHTVLWSEAWLTWKCPAESLTFRIYVNDVCVGETDSMEYHITDLVPGSDNVVKVSSVFNGEESYSNVERVTTPGIWQITKNIGPTSVSVGFENVYGSQTNNSPLFYVELYDTDDLSSSPQPVYSTYVLDAHLQSPGSPFVASKVLSNDSKQSSVPTGLAFGGLEPGRSYWFRIRYADTYTYKSYVSSTAVDATTSTPAGASEFSTLVELKTGRTHEMEQDEVLFQGFDGITLMADMVNAVPGLLPAVKADASVGMGKLTGKLAKEWTGAWSFSVLRTVLNASQFAQLGGKVQQNSNNHGGPFVLNNTNANATVTTPAFCKGAKMYEFTSDWSGMEGWYFSNGTWPSQGCVQLGSYYNSSESKDQRLGFIATPELSSDKLGNVAKACKVTFKALAIQGRGVTLKVGHYNGSTWAEPISRSICNSAGLITDASEWSAGSDAHRWYDYEVDLDLKNGDIVVFATDVDNKNGTVMIDDISIKIK